MSTILEKPAVAYPLRTLLDSLALLASSPPVALKLWDGSVWSKGEPRFTIVLNSPDMLGRLLRFHDELELGEAFIAHDFDIEGDIEAAFEFGDFLSRAHWKLADRLRLVRTIFKFHGHYHESNSHRASLRGGLHSQDRDRNAVSYHYDISNDFYCLWLDPWLLYSCAYFKAGTENLEAAQTAKLDYLCRKLRLRPGETLLDIGCGWGGLVLYAAQQFGVRACGVTISTAQADLARRRVRELDLDDRCEVRLSDYREIPPADTFDKIVSVGMFEHVGERHLGEYFAKVWNHLRPGGVFLNHGIAASALYQRKGESFIDKYVFPDGELVPLGTTIRAAEEAGFEVRDVESLREHYHLTLRHWARRLKEHAPEAIAATNDSTFRTWYLYLSSCAHAFKTGRVNIYQVLLSKPDRGDARLPWTRADWYYRENEHWI